MNRIWSFICLLCGGSTLFAQPLTWEACQRQARDRYPLIRQYKLIEQTTQLSVANLQKGYYPQLSVSAQASYVSDVPAFPDAMKKMFSSVVSLDGIPKDQYKVAVDVNQVVWDGGEIRARRQLSQTEGEVAARETDVNLYALRARINELFFGLLLLDEQVKQQCAQDGLLGAHIARMEAYVRDSVGLPSDLDAILAQRLQLRQQLTSLLSARRTYSRVLSLFVAGKPTDSLVIEHPREAIVSDNPYRRPEMAWFDAQSRQLAAQRKAVDASVLPRLGIFASGSYSNPGLNYMEAMLHSRWEWGYQVGLRLQWSPSNFYTRRNSLQRIEAQRALIENNRDVFLFQRQLETAEEQESVARFTRLLADDDRLIRLRMSVRRAAEARFENGVIDMTDLLQKITDETVARTARSSHEIERLKALYEMKITTNQ